MPIRPRPRRQISYPLHICGMSRVCARGERCRHGMTHDPGHACCRSNRTLRQCICTNFILGDKPDQPNKYLTNEFGRTILAHSLCFGICVPYEHWQRTILSKDGIDIVTYKPDLGKFNGGDWRNYRSLETYMGFYSSKLSLINKNERRYVE